MKSNKTLKKELKLKSKIILKFVGCLAVLMSLSVGAIAQENCSNGIDDDGDGLIDCYDGDCEGDTSCDGFYYGNTEPTCKYVPQAGGAFSLVEVWKTDETIAPMDQRQTVLVADIDNDGVPEIIGKDDNQGGSGKIYIFDGRDGSLELEITTPAQALFLDALAVADVDGDGTGEIFMVSSDAAGRQLIRYEHTGGAATWMSATQVGYTSESQKWSPQIADFNGDGISEVYLGNQVFSAVDGTLIAEGGAANSKGGYSTISAAQNEEPFSVAMDVLDDAACADCSGLELVAGNQVYSVNVGTGAMTIEVTAPVGLNDGMTSIVDFDQDGDLDAVVNPSEIIYVWDLQTSTQIGTTYTMPPSTAPSGATIGGHATVGDVDGDGRPEIGLAVENIYIVLDDLVAGANTLTEKWTKVVSDKSQRTSSTLYDFHGDGLNEIVYSDQDSLYIFDGRDGSVLSSVYCPSGTRTEYPIVADANGDGYAEIIVSCQDLPGPIGVNSEVAYISMFRSPEFPWVSARKVWNQHNYFATNINDDLSVPMVQQQNYLVPDMNDFLAQTYMRKSDGSPTFAAADAIGEVTGFDFSNCAVGANTIDVTIELTNQGDWNLPYDMPISFYNGNPYEAGSTLISTETLGSNLDAGDAISLTYTIPDQGGSFYLFSLVNHNGSGATPLSNTVSFVGECDFTNNLDGAKIENCAWVNDAPSADSNTVTTDEDVAYVFNESDFNLNYSDLEGDTLAEVKITFPTALTGVLMLNGVAVVDGQIISITDILAGNLTFVPVAQENGSPYTSFDFAVGDGSDFDASPSTMTVNVLPINDTPIADSKTITVDENTSNNALGLGAPSDIDGDVLTISVTELPVLGEVTLADGSPITIGMMLTEAELLGLVYHAPADYDGVTDPGDFGYEVSDGSVSVSGIVNINVNPLNDAPIAVNDFETVGEDGTLNASVTGNDSDPNGDNLTYTLVGAGPDSETEGLLVLAADGTYTFTPVSDFNGTVSFEYQVCDDGIPMACATAFVEIEVVPINDGPVAEDDTYQGEENTEVIGSVLDNDFDVEGDNLTVNTNPLSGPDNGTLTLNADGTFEYIPAAGFVGTDTFVYEVCDSGSPSLCTTAEVTIVIEASNEITVYQGISPGSGTRNAKWNIEGIQNYPNNKVKIFNRWGNLVYKVYGYNNNDKVWEGQSSEGLVIGANTVPDGTYFYVLDLGNGAKPMSGYIVVNK